MNELVLVNSKFFNGVRFDCYQDAQQNDSSDFWATRTQIGELLEYSDPTDAIAKIHGRTSFQGLIKLIYPLAENRRSSFTTSKDFSKFAAILISLKLTTLWTCFGILQTKLDAQEATGLNSPKKNTT